MVTVIPTQLLSSETDRHNFPPYLELRARYQPCSPRDRHLPSLPPVVVVLADDLQDVAGVEGYPGLGAGDEVVIQRVVLELGPHEDVAGGRGGAVGGDDLGVGELQVGNIFM